MHTVWKNAGANRPRGGACSAVRCNRVVRLLLLLRASTIVFDHDVQTVQWKTPPVPSSAATSVHSEGTYTARNVLRSVFRLYCVQIKIRCTRTCSFTITTAFFRLEKSFKSFCCCCCPFCVIAPPWIRLTLPDEGDVTADAAPPLQDVIVQS